MKAQKCLLAFLALVNVTTARAIDFKIDLPAESGKSSNSNNTSQVAEELIDNSKENNNKQLDETNLVDEVKNMEDDHNIILDIPEAPSAIVPRNNKSNNTKKTNITAELAPQTNAIDLSFPTPQCLKSNVVFWEKVYSDADVNDAIVHDKENLGRVFGVARLPTNPQARKAAVNNTRDYYRTKIVELSEMLNSPKSWSKEHAEIAKLFKKNELNRETLIRSSNNLRVQTGLKSRFEDGIQRSLTHIPMIFDTLKQKKIPTDIAYLPHVESSYHQFARSKVGAVGLWQIMPGTMKILAGQKAVNKRTDPYIATQAAAKLLHQNYQTTKSWPLALTAYNHGLYGVMRAVKATNSTDLCEIIAKYESRSFRFASSNFYAQFLAARNVAMNRYIQISSRPKHKNTLKPLLAASEAYKGKM